MYNVTDNYRELIKSPVRYTGLNGAVRLKDGTTIQLNDGNVDSGSLQIINKLNRRGDFRPGGVYSSEMSIGLKGFDGKTSDLDGAILRLNFQIYPDASMSASNAETVPLGRFYVDGSTIKRRRDKVTLCANDALVLFDIPASERSGTFYDLVEAACAAAGVGFGMTKDDFEKLPNATLSASTNAARIQTEHDLLMYVGMATSSFARIRREDNKLEFKPLSCEKDEKNMIIPVREIAGDIRFTTDFSDDTTRISKVFTRRNGSVVSSSLTVTPGGSEKLTMLELDDNPLFSALSDTDLISAMNNELSQLYQCLNRAFDASFTGDPALDIGDYVRLRGGAIDTDRGYATGMITSQIWRYRGQHTIKCSLPSSMTSTGSTSAATVAAYTADTPSDQYRLQPKSQLEKRMDALEAAQSGASDSGTLTEYKYLTDTSVKFNGTTYTVEKDADTGLISKISDSAGNEFEPELSSGITDVALHNAVFWAVAMCRGLNSSTIMPVRDGLVGYFDFKHDCTAALWTNRLGGDNIPISGSAAVDSECLKMPSGTYGLFPMEYSEDFTLYAVAKADYDSTQNQHDCIIGSSSGNSTGAWRTISTDGFSADEHFRCWFSDTYGGGIGTELTDGSAVKAYESYSVIALVQSSGKLRMYINGMASADNPTVSGRYGNYWGLNCLASADGKVNQLSKTGSYFKMFALGREAHTAAQVAKNTAWLKKYYGI